MALCHQDNSKIGLRCHLVILKDWKALNHKARCLKVRGQSNLLILLIDTSNQASKKEISLRKFKLDKTYLNSKLNYKINSRIKVTSMVKPLIQSTLLPVSKMLRYTTQVRILNFQGRSSSKQYNIAASHKKCWVWIRNPICKRYRFRLYQRLRGKKLEQQQILSDKQLSMPILLKKWTQISSWELTSKSICTKTMIDVYPAVNASESKIRIFLTSTHTRLSLTMRKNSQTTNLLRSLSSLTWIKRDNRWRFHAKLVEISYPCISHNSNPIPLTLSLLSVTPWIETMEILTSRAS